MSDLENKSSHFIHNMIDTHLEQKRFHEVVTVFPRTNGYLHLVCQINCFNFTTAQKYGGRCHLRFDDTNPLKKSKSIDSIKTDVKWLGFDWKDKEFYASDYFEQLTMGEFLIKESKAYVCDLTAEETRLYRGTLKERERKPLS